MTLLAANNLSVKIGNRQVCEDLNLRFASNQVWAILGSNGVGKTTLLHTLAGLHPIEAGAINLYGDALMQYQRREVAQHIGVLFQHQDDPFPSTVMETALIGRHPFIDRWRGETVEDINLADQALKLVELDGFQDRSSTNLSGGEKQRLKIATLMTQAPKIMLLDEPTNHLDLNHQIKLLRLLIEFTMQREGLVLMSLHDLNLAKRFCTHALLLNPDHNPLIGTIEEVFQPEHLERAYGWPVDRFKVEGREFYFPR